MFFNSFRNSYDQLWIKFKMTENKILEKEISTTKNVFFRLNNDK